MRSGLFDYLGDGDTTVTDRLFSKDPTHRWSPLELIAISNRTSLGLRRTPRGRTATRCYVLLGQIVERTTGHLLGDELRARVFVPRACRRRALTPSRGSPDGTPTATSGSASCG
jgi:hypothetical protein